jgi:hypothetical protein
MTIPRPEQAYTTTLIHETPTVHFAQLWLLAIYKPIIHKFLRRKFSLAPT